jgi:DNA-binding NtrC family response regulator
MTLKDMLLDYERRLILAALAAADGHQRRAARSLGLLPTTLHEKMKRLGIPTATAPRPLHPQ